MRKLAVFMFVVFAATAFANPFADVKRNHWAYDAISKLAAKGIITGYPDGTFKGNKSVSRYDVAVIIARLVENVNMTPGLKTRMSNGDLDSVQKLVVEFADELSLLGVKITALEDEMSAVRDDLSVLKEDVRTLRSTGGQGGKIRISGDIRKRFYDFSYEEEAVEAAANENFFETWFSLNLDMRIDPDITAFVRLQKCGFWNSQNGDWSTQNAAFGALGMQTDTDLQTYMAYIKIKDFFGWADHMKFGRQRVALGREMLLKGIADGITFQKTVDSKREIVCRVGGFKLDDAQITTAPEVYNDNEGLDMAFIDWTFDLSDVMAEIYAIHSRDPISGVATMLADATTTYKHVKRQTWYGVALSGNPVPELTLWGEYSWLNWDESVDVDGNNDNEDGDSGFLCGLNWEANRKTRIKLQYMMFDQYFWKPQSTGRRTIWDVDRYLDPDETFLYDAAGYRADFDDLMAEIDYKITEKASVLGRYEMIDDNSNLAANQANDDRSIITGILSYQYKPNTMFRFFYRKTNCEENQPNAVADTLVVPATQTNTTRLGDVQALGITDTSLLSTAAPNNIHYVDDVTEIILEMLVTF